jgi:hypothetical protein
MAYSGKFRQRCVRVLATMFPCLFKRGKPLGLHGPHSLRHRNRLSAQRSRAAGTLLEVVAHGSLLRNVCLAAPLNVLALALSASVFSNIANRNTFVAERLQQPQLGGASQNSLRTCSPDDIGIGGGALSRDCGFYGCGAVRI